MYRTLVVTVTTLGLVVGGPAAAFAATQDSSPGPDPSATSTAGPAPAPAPTPTSVTNANIAPGPNEVPIVWHDTYALDDKTTAYHTTDTSQEIGSCHAASKVTCTISKTTSAARTIQTQFGLTYGAAAALLNISSDSSVSTEVSCSATVPAGHALYAYPWGTRYTYVVHHHRYYTEGDSNHYGITDEYSGTKVAFSPGANDVTCKVV